MHSSSPDKIASAVPMFIIKENQPQAPKSAPVPATKVNDRASELIINAMTLKRSGETELAEGLFRQALNLEPYNETALRLLIESLNGKESRNLERRKLAELYYKKFPKSLGSYFWAKELSIEGEIDLAKDLFFEASVAAADDLKIVFEIYKEIGNIAVRQGDFESAEEHYHKALAVDPLSDTVHINLGTLEIQRGSWQKAQESFSNALELNSRNDRAWVGAALVNKELQRMDLAWANLRNALDYNKKNRMAVMLMAAWSHSAGQSQEAVDCLTTYLSEISSAECFDFEISQVLIQIFIELKRWDDVVLELQRSLAMDPQQKDLLELLPEVLSQQAQT